MNSNYLQTTLLIAAGLQMAVAVLNLNLVRVLKWRPDLNKLPLLIREVFMVHLWFISATLVIFATLTWRFAEDIACGGSEMARWCAACIAAFWGIRAILQVTYYPIKRS